MTPTVAAPQATPASGDEGARQQVLAETKRPSVAFLTPEVASYFIGMLFLDPLGNVRFQSCSISGRMCRRCFANGRQSSGAA
jgi:hypothetical protein